ncbi:hypothetical protein H5410_002850 [Solanum commersonii]|uniref:Uncharacterized protein n=1 Tax=Solanum commersonii TaxID=4109 RepID=A0A9J6B301_SOLCO|nr:hypothetical protein H5410_002850 [Solanum commersonii]
MEECIHSASKAGNLSPRHIEEKLIFWNIRSVKSQKAFGRLVDLHRRHQYSYIALLEPFQGPEELEHYKRQLGFQNAMENLSSKIWISWNEELLSQVVKDNIQ